MMKNIKWVALLTFILGYVVSTATAGSEPSARAAAAAGGAEGTLSPLAETAESRRTLDARWQTADIDTTRLAAVRGLRPNVINRPDALRGVFDVLCRSGRPLRVLQVGDSHVAGGSYPAALRATLEQAWGKAGNDSTGTGVSFSYMGRNGATAQQFANSEKVAQIAARCPDLIILSFGTNECHGMGYSEELHRVQLEDFYAMLTEACPSAVIMMTTPPGDYLTTRRSYRSRSGRRVVRSAARINPMSERCAAALESFGRQNGLAVWDLNAIAGGKTAVVKWQSAGLMKPDRVHFTPDGYRLHGRLLGEAILKAYNSYLQ